MPRLRPLAVLFRRQLSVFRTRLIALPPFINQHKHALIRYGPTLLLACLVVTILVAKLSGERYANSVQHTRTDLQRLQDSLAHIIEPNEIELGQQDLSVDYLLDQTDPSVVTFRAPVTPPRPLLFIHLLPAVNYPYEVFAQTGRIAHDTSALTRYQHQVFLAIQPVLEYNPRAEFADKTLNDEEIKLRINTSRDGLIQATMKLRELDTARSSDHCTVPLVAAS